MKAKIKLAIAAGLSALAICLFLGWVGGFNFDHRNPDVAAACFFGALCVGGIVAIVITFPND